MSEQADHLTGRWELLGPYPAVRVGVCVDPGFSHPDGSEPGEYEAFATFMEYDEPLENRKIALERAERVISCVNALAGLNPEAVRELVKWAEKTIDMRDPDALDRAVEHDAEFDRIVSRLRVGRGEERGEHEG